jgi:hypothetical protein
VRREQEGEGAVDRAEIFAVIVIPPFARTATP